MRYSIILTFTVSCVSPKAKIPPYFSRLGVYWNLIFQILIPLTQGTVKGKIKNRYC